MTTKLTATSMVNTLSVSKIDDFHTEILIEWVKNGHMNDDSIQSFLGWVQDWYWENKEEILK